MDCSGAKNSFTVGRAYKSDLLIPLHSISREQCKFTFGINGKWALEVTSLSGTWVNDKKLIKNKPRLLKDKDRIRLGTDSIVYEFNSRPTPCGSECLSPRPNNCPQRSKDLALLSTDKKPLSQLSSTSHSIVKENATLAGYVPESQLKVLAAEYADRRKKLVQTFTADLHAQKEMYEREKQKKELKIAKLKEQNLTLSKVSEDLKDKLKVKVEELKHPTEEHNNLVKEKELIVEENKLFLKEKIRLEKEVDRLTAALELSSREVTALKEEKDLVSREKEALSTVQDTLERSIAEADALKDLAAENQLHAFEELMESELQCSICTEIIVNAQTLVCGHTFCQICIDEWREKNPRCPNCRKKVKRTCPSKVVDSRINKMVDNLTGEFKRKREQIVNEKEETNAYKRRQTGVPGAPQAYIDLTSMPGPHNR